MDNTTECWVNQYNCIYGLSKHQKMWLCLFTVDEFNALLLEVIPHDVIINSPKLTILDCLELLMEHQGYRVRY